MNKQSIRTLLTDEPKKIKKLKSHILITLKNANKSKEK